MAGSRDSDSVVVERLGVANYAVWAQRMKFLLIRKGLWSAVENAEDDDSQKALATIGLHVEDYHLATLAGCDTAKEAWDTLKAQYQARSNATKLQLRRQLNSLRMRPDEPLTKYVARVKEIRNQLAAAGCEVTEAELVWSMLAGLHKEYDAVVAALETSGNDYTLDEVLVKLMPTEQRLNKAFTDDDIVEERAYYTRVERVKECWYCHQKGHLKNNCPKLRKDGKRNNVALFSCVGL